MASLYHHWWNSKVATLWLPNYDVGNTQEKQFCSPDFLQKTWYFLVGGFNPSEKYESQLGWFFPTEWKVIKIHGSSHHQADDISHDISQVSSPKWVWVKTLYPNNWMVNTKLDIHICGPTSVFHFDPHPNHEKNPRNLPPSHWASRNLCSSTSSESPCAAPILERSRIRVSETGGWRIRYGSNTRSIKHMQKWEIWVWINTY